MKKKHLLILLILINLFFFPITIFCQQSQNINISVDIGVEELPPPPPTYIPGFGGQPTKVTFRGMAYPKALLTILKNNEVSSTFFAEDSGLFLGELIGLEGGNYNFSIFAEDNKGRKSVTLNFNVGVLGGAITRISGIFIPPTIEASPTEAEKGEKIQIYGQGFPESEIDIFISPGEIVKKTKVLPGGDWLYILETGDLEEREYNVVSKAFYKDGEQTPFSNQISFLIIPKSLLPCHGMDLNFDGEVDVIDFSILLYFWGSTNPQNKCVDENSDGIVDVFDFSLMMYEWTG
jgi:hypothetical protein